MEELSLKEFLNLGKKRFKGQSSSIPNRHYLWYRGFD